MASHKALNIIFAGTPDFAAVALAALLKSRHKVIAVYTQPDRPAGRGRKLKASPVKQLALEHNLPILQPTGLKGADEQQQLADFQPDLMVVAAYGLLLPRAVLDIPRFGCLNIHASLLPRWRGAAPIQRAILAGDAESGITIMQMDEGLDTGDMLLKLTTPISEEDTAQSLHDRLAVLGADALLQALERLPGGLVPEPQDEALASYAKKLDKQEAAIDWRQPAIQIARQVNAFNPWPVAQTQLEDKVLRIWEALPVPDNCNATPGTVIAQNKQGIDIATGMGILRVTRLQLPGGKPLTAADFINSRQITGSILGACRA
jgi:methionyl-tRNA formyltransferase